MPDIRILTEGDSSVLVEFGKEINRCGKCKISGFRRLCSHRGIWK